MLSKKDIRQQGIVDKWLGLCCGTLEAVTGFGKTRVAILIIQRMLWKDNTRTTLVVVPSKKLLEDWISPTGHIVKYNLTGVTVMVINTLIKHSYTCDLLVLDEIHNYAATQFYKVFELVTYRWILGLTATIDRLDGKDVLLRQKCPVFEQVSMKEAEDEGYISKFYTFNLAVDFTISEQRLYDQSTNTMNAMFARFGHDFDLAKRCMAGKAMGGDHVRGNYATTMGWKPTDGDGHPWSPASIAKYAIQWNRAISSRKKLLYQSKSKLTAAVEVLKTLRGKTITFSESTDFADELAKLDPTGSKSYHSNVSSINEQYTVTKSYKTKPNVVTTKSRQVSGTMLNKRALIELSDLNSPVRCIHTAKALDEGFDVEDIEIALICSSTSSPRQNIQRTGRAVRFVVDKVATIINLYHPNTQDEKWLNARQGKNNRAIWATSIEQITRYLTPTSLI